jgi:hypothetical protein
MAFGFRRNRNGGLKPLLEQDSTAVSSALGAAGGDEELDLELSMGDLFDAAPTQDLETLKGGTTPRRFYQEELSPNWDGLSKAERAAKIEAFARFANVLGKDDPGGMGAVVRTKLLVLAWAYDAEYDESLTRRLTSKPEQFGKLDLSPVR